ncbi:MAG: hypothetical protein GY723_11345 [bacterium]|nr:hypothetical protein [bacterium]MCP5067495.1 hypothetical protein [bacterium]
MDLVPVLSTVIFVATIATMILAVFSYAAFKLREKRKPKGSDEKPVFFHHFKLAGADENADAGPE